MYHFYKPKIEKNPSAIYVAIQKIVSKPSNTCNIAIAIAI